MWTNISHSWQETGAQIVALGSYHQLDLDVFCADYDEAGYRCGRLYPPPQPEASPVPDASIRG